MKKYSIGAALAVSAAGATLAAALAVAQPSGAQTGGDGAQPNPAAGMAGVLMKGLTQTEGCLGADAAQTQSGRNCIIGWFENKEAVVRWYNSMTHQGIMRGVAGGLGGGEPLAHVADGTGPIMVIATITFSETPKFEAIRMPISQISIELFQPLPGGAHLGGRLSPEAFKVEHMRDFTPQDGAASTGSAGG